MVLENQNMEVWKESGIYQYVIKYPGITLEHVMASGTLPEFYDYAEVPLDQTMKKKTWIMATKMTYVTFGMGVYWVIHHSQNYYKHIKTIGHL